MVGQDRGQLVEMALFWRPVDGFLADTVSSCELGDIWLLDDGTRLALSVVESEIKGFKCVSCTYNTLKFSGNI